MDADRITPWVEVVALHPDVLSEHFSEDIFALDLGPLADGNPHNEGRCGFVDLQAFSAQLSVVSPGRRGVPDSCRALPSAI